MKSWQQKLNKVPTDKAGNKYCSEQLSILIIREFMQDEIYNIFNETVSSLPDKSLIIGIYPEFKEDISTNKPNIHISIGKALSKKSNEFSLDFNNGEPNLILNSVLNHEKSYKRLGSIDINNPENTTIIKSYFDSLIEAFMSSAEFKA